MARLRVLERLEEVAQRDWNGLLGPGSCPFLEHGWLSPLEQAGCAVPRRGWVPRHLTLWEGNELVAAAPAYLKTHSEGEFVFDWRWAEAASQLGITYYPKLVLAIPFTPVVAEKLLVRPGLGDRERLELSRDLVRAAVALAEAESCSSVHVLFCTPAEVELLEEQGFGHRTGMQFHWQNAGYRSYDDFLAQFTSRRRKNLRREQAEVERSGLTIRTLEGDELTPERMDQLYRFYLTTVDKYVWGRRYLTRQLFQRIGETFRHRLLAVMAFRGDTPIAAALDAASETTLYGRYWGATEDVRFLHFDVCFYRGIALCIDRGLRTFEPGAGGEHKYERGFEPVITHSAHHIFDPRLSRGVSAFLARERRALAEHVAELRARSPLRGPRAGEE